MLFIYRKDTKDVIHYVEDNVDGVRPTLFGLYHSCIKHNYPNLKLSDIGELVQGGNGVDTEFRNKVFEYEMKVEEENGEPKHIIFDRIPISDPPIKTKEQENEERLKKLEELVLKQQELIDKLTK